jgi:hypothetical protein
MKYDFLVKEKISNTSDEISNHKNNESFLGSTMLSTYEDFNVFLKKTQVGNLKNIDIQDSKNDTNIKDHKDLEDNKYVKVSKNENSRKTNNSTLFESEKKTVETIVKYSSSFINFLLKLVFILKNTFIYLISKKKINNESIKDKEIIDKFKRHNNKKNKHIVKKDKHIERREKDIKKMNSYLLELE